MRVTVYKGEGKELSVLVEASVWTMKAPVLTKGITTANLVERVLPVVEAQRGRREKPANSPS